MDEPTFMAYELRLLWQTNPPYEPFLLGVGVVFDLLMLGQCLSNEKNFLHLSGTGDSQRDSRESIRAHHSQFKPLFFIGALLNST